MKQPFPLKEPTGSAVMTSSTDGIVVAPLPSLVTVVNVCDTLVPELGVSEINSTAFGSPVSFHVPTCRHPLVFPEVSPDAWYIFFSPAKPERKLISKLVV